MTGTLEEAASAISQIISIGRDAEQGFRAAASAARDTELRELLVRYSDQHGSFAATLQESVKALGYDPEAPAGLGGIIYGGWINLKALVTSHDQHGILVEAERGEAWVVNAYRDAAGKNLPVGLRPIVDAQLAEIEQMHEYLRRRRDVTAPKEEKDAHGA